MTLTGITPPAFTTITQGAVGGAGDVNQMIQSLNGTALYGPGPGWVQIATQTLGSTTSTVWFSGSFPVSIYNNFAFNHLALVYKARSSAAATTANLYLRPDFIQTATYDTDSLVGTGGTVTSSETNTQTSMTVGKIAAASSTASMYGVGWVVMPNWYAQNCLNACALNGTAFTNAGNATSANVFGGFSFDFSAITGGLGNRSALWILTDGNFVSGSSFTIYGSM